MTRRVAVLGAALAATTAAVAAPGAASAASGGSVLTLKGAAASSLSTAKVKASAVAPARAKGKAITFPVRTVSVGSTATLAHSGALKLTRAGRSLTLGAPTLRLAGSGSRLTAKIGGKITTILTVDARKRSLNGTAGTVALKGATVKLTAAGAAAIKRVLKLKALKAGTFGTLTVDATRGGTGGSTGSGGSTGGGTTGGGTGTGGGSTGGGSTGGGTTGGGSGSAPKTCSTGALPTASGGPAALAKPLGAYTVTAASITWHVRDSFIQYINSGEGTAVGGGATADPASVQPGSSASLVYQFHFPFKDGWYDPLTNKTRLTYSGTVAFCYADHGIKLTAANPEIEIDPTNNTRRAIFTTSNVDTPDKRGVLVNFDSATRVDNGNDHAWTQMPGRIPADAGDSTFAGYYAANEPFGWITATATAAP